MNTDSSPVVVKGLCVAFGKRRVLDGLDFELARGSATALVGANAAGKSTLLRVLVGALAPDRGSCRVLRLDPAREGARLRARIGYVPDRLELPSWMRVRDWLRFAARLYPTWSASEQSKLCDLLQLDPSVRVSELSKGNRAKLGLVTALAHRPRLLLLDEAFSGLDASTRHTLSTAVIGHLRNDGRTLVMASHSTADIERVCDRVAVLANGRIEREEDLETFARAERGGVDLDAALRRDGAGSEVAA